MADQQELAVREKREVAAKEERTVPGRFATCTRRRTR